MNTKNTENDDEFLGEGNFYKGNFYFHGINVEVPYFNEFERTYLWAASHDSSITLVERIESVNEVIDRNDLETVFPAFMVTRPYKKEIVVFLQNSVITKKMVQAMDQVTAYAKALGGEVMFVRKQNCSFEDELSFRMSYTCDSEADN